MAIGVSANVGGAPEGETLFGRITLTPSDPTVPSVTLPVAVVPSTGVLPDAVEFETRRDAGSQVVPDIQSIGVTEFTGSMDGFVKATQTVGSLNEDPTNADPYDDLGQVAVHLVDVPAGASRLVAEILAAEMPDLDMFVGTGSTPGPDTEVCVSASGSNLEHCDIPDPAGGHLVGAHPELGGHHRPTRRLHPVDRGRGRRRRQRRRGGPVRADPAGAAL